MDKHNTTTIQEVRRDPLGFLKKIDNGDTITVIYRSKPLAVVTSAKEEQAKRTTNIKRMLEYAELARKSAKNPLGANVDYKTMYDDDVAQKYDIS
jgi:antitoxin (DNA-binding transcriptional repressor) of toxin-antitoxin stability system